MIAYTYSIYIYINSYRTSKRFSSYEKQIHHGEAVYENGESCSISAANLLSGYATDCSVINLLTCQQALSYF